MRVLRIPFSTNVERVALALAFKGMPVEWVEVDPADARPSAASGQDLVPVLQTDQNEVIVDSMRIVAWLEARRPDPPLWPADPARRAEVDVFVEWFNRVWKTPAERDRGRARPAAARPREDRRLGRGDARVAALVRGALLEGRDHLMGDTFGAADVAAFPFLKYGVFRDPDDDEPSTGSSMEHLPIAGAFPRVEAWIRRVDSRPRA